MAGQKKTPVKPIVPVYGYKGTKPENVGIGKDVKTFLQYRNSIGDYSLPDFQAHLEAFNDPYSGKFQNPADNIKRLGSAGKELGKQIKRIPQQYRRYRINKRFKQMLPTQQDWNRFDRMKKMRSISGGPALMRLAPLITSGISTLSKQIRENNQREMSNR